MSITDRAYNLLRDQGPMRGSDLGWLLWEDTTECASRGEGSHGQNKFCRAAGKVLNQLEREGRVRQYHSDLERCTKWKAI